MIEKRYYCDLCGVETKEKDYTKIYIGWCGTDVIPGVHYDVVCRTCYGMIISLIEELKGGSNEMDKKIKGNSILWPMVLL